MVDSRLNLIGVTNKKVKILDYDSDHNAITFGVQINMETERELNVVPPSAKFKYKATSWKKFEQKAISNLPTELPACRNLSNEEINEHLELLSVAITDTIEEMVPRHKANNDVYTYVNNSIKRLRKTKTRLLTMHRKILLLDSRRESPQLLQVKELLANVKAQLKKELRQSANKYWANKIKQIDYRNPNRFFPVINRIFRPKGKMGIEEIHTSTADVEILSRSACNLNQWEVVDGKYVFTDPPDNLNILGAYYESINSPRHLNSNTSVQKIVNSKVQSIKADLQTLKENAITYTTSSKTNRADLPSPASDPDQILCDTTKVLNILRKLPNKSSSELDNIPPIVLKHLSVKYVKNYTILFNNALNNYFFPTGWRKAKVLPILKKGKDPRSPSSYRPISMTPSISKVFEIMLNKRVVNFCDDHNIIPENQFGFKRSHSTIHAIN